MEIVKVNRIPLTRISRLLPLLRGFGNPQCIMIKAMLISTNNLGNKSTTLHILPVASTKAAFESKLVLVGGDQRSWLRWHEEKGYPPGNEHIPSKGNFEDELPVSNWWDTLVPWRVKMGKGCEILNPTLVNKFFQKF